MLTFSNLSDGNAVCSLYHTWLTAITEAFRQVLKYKDDVIPLLRRLRDHTFSKRGFSWSGKLLSSLLLTLTHTYPLEDKFVNPKEWNSEGTETDICSFHPSF